MDGVIDLDSVDLPPAIPSSYPHLAPLDRDGLRRIDGAISTTDGISPRGMSTTTTTTPTTARRRAGRAARPAVPPPDAADIIDIDEIPDPPQHQTRDDIAEVSRTMEIFGCSETAARRLMGRGYPVSDAPVPDDAATSTRAAAAAARRGDGDAVRTVRVGGGIGDNLHSRLAIIRRDAVPPSQRQTRSTTSINTNSPNHPRRPAQTAPEWPSAALFERRIYEGLRTIDLARASRRVVPIASMRYRVGDPAMSRRAHRYAGHSHSHHHHHPLPLSDEELLMLGGLFDEHPPEDFVEPELHYGGGRLDVPIRHRDGREFTYGQLMQEIDPLVDDEIIRLMRDRSRSRSTNHAEIKRAPTVPPASKHFTRMVRAGRKLRCAECEWELGAPSQEFAEAAKAVKEYNEVPEAERIGTAPKMPQGVDAQRKMFAGKCGHVYCGGCMKKHRTLIRRPRKDGASGACVVEGCNTNISGPRAMIEMFC
ncbi:hypothetical protein BZA70DRAFT_278084 [Myxozyma melibiosi]|uniref:RING-type domain-containing protein n=1 Tax=Myxozyma melibiosi TaxID=54550 RepID=A0ABR1F8H1_9ASCO